jgi:hypothetical protein
VTKILTRVARNIGGKVTKFLERVLPEILGESDQNDPVIFKH